MKVIRSIWPLTKDTFQRWLDDKVPRLGAALSYYTVFSLAPVLILVIALAGLIFGRDAAQGKIVGELRGLVGNDGAAIIQSMILQASIKSGGVIATVVGVVTLLVGATGVVVELQDALNTIWKVAPKPGRGVMGMVRDRMLSFGLILAFGFLSIVSLAMSAGLAALGGWFSHIVPGWVVLGYVVNYGISFAIITLMFATMYKLLPDVKIAWRDVWVGAAVTSVLFHIGKFLIGLYLGKATVASGFGAAGSLAVILVWVYYTSQIVLLGAEFTRVYADMFGSHVRPSDNAVSVAEGPAPHAAPEQSASSRPLPTASPSR
ncbi:MAG: YihY/virulence factor BrkB family protein [Myxococcota bacterium]|nr:YihY/virulence factor BrkB family protein [Myxococcota bacterium]